MSEGCPADRGRVKRKRQQELTDWRRKEGSRQRETSGVFGAQSHRPTAVHYKGGYGVGSKEKERCDLTGVDPALVAKEMKTATREKKPKDKQRH